MATAAAAEASIVAAVAKRRSSEATRRNQNPAMLKDATIDDLKDSKVLADGLRALVHVRSFKSSKCEIKLPGKGTVDEAKAGTENLFSMVHRLKARPIVIRAPAPPTPVVVPPPVPPTERTIAADGGGGTGGGGGGGGGGGSGGGGGGGGVVEDAVGGDGGREGHEVDEVDEIEAELRRLEIKQKQR